MKNVISVALGILLFGCIAGLTAEVYHKRRNTPTVAVYCEVELSSGNQVKTIFWVPDDYRTLEIRPRRGEFWLVATTPRGDIRLMPGVIYVHKFTRQKNRQK